MKKWLVLMLVFLLVPVLCACGGEKPEEELTQPVTIAPVAQPTTAPVTQPTEPATTPPAPTEPAHSEFYLADYTPEQVTEYFEEVVLAAEYTDGTGDASLVQKWLSPIRYGIYGDPTDEDLAVLEDFFSQLNAVPGFPGIRPAEAGEGEELTLSFLNKEDFNAAFSDVVGAEADSTVGGDVEGFAQAGGIVALIDGFSGGGQVVKVCQTDGACAVLFPDHIPVGLVARLVGSGGGIPDADDAV